MKLLLLILFPLLVVSQNNEESVSDQNIFTVFYNVENLFDTINNPNTNDDEFLPNSEKKWNSSKYFHKINQLARALAN